MRTKTFGFICGITAVALTVLFAGAASAQTFNWSVDCPNNTVVGPVTVLPVNFTGQVTLTPGVPLVTALLPGANLIRRDNPAAPPGISTATLQCTLTFGGVTVPFTRSLSLQVSGGSGDMTVGAVSVFVNLGVQGLVTLSAPAFTTIGYDSTIPIIAVPLLLNTTALLAPPSIPTLSTWGMIAMLATLLTLGFFVLGRRPPAPA